MKTLVLRTLEVCTLAEGLEFVKMITGKSYGRMAEEGRFYRKTLSSWKKLADPTTPSQNMIKRVCSVTGLTPALFEIMQENECRTDAIDLGNSKKYIKDTLNISTRELSGYLGVPENNIRNMEHNDDILLRKFCYAVWEYSSKSTATITDLRNSRHMSIIEFSELLDIDPNEVVKMEQYNYVPLHNLEKIEGKIQDVCCFPLIPERTSESVKYVITKLKASFLRSVTKEAKADFNKKWKDLQNKYLQAKHGKYYTYEWLVEIAILLQTTPENILNKANKSKRESTMQCLEDYKAQLRKTKQKEIMLMNKIFELNEILTSQQTKQNNQENTTPAFD